MVVAVVGFAVGLKRPRGPVDVLERPAATGQAVALDGLGRPPPIVVGHIPVAPGRPVGLAGRVGGRPRRPCPAVGPAGRPLAQVGLATRHGLALDRLGRPDHVVSPEDDVADIVGLASPLGLGVVVVEAAFRRPAGRVTDLAEAQAACPTPPQGTPAYRAVGVAAPDAALDDGTGGRVFLFHFLKKFWEL